MKNIPHSRPSISKADVSAVLRSLKSGQLSRGEISVSFEKALARRFAARDAVLVSSGTAALHLSLLALGIGPGDEVIVPAHVCPAVLNAVRYTGAREKLVDVREDGTIDPSLVRKVLNPYVRALVAVHLWGNPADMKALVKFGIPVIEDCAQAVGACLDGKPVGTFGHSAVLSFYATKMLAAGEGGAVISKDLKFMTRVRDLFEYDHRPEYRQRFNYKLTDLQAALAASQFRQLNGFIARRRAIAARYTRSFARLPVELPCPWEGASPAFYRYVMLLTAQKGDVDQFVARARRNGVDLAKPLFKPLHEYVGGGSFPVSDMLMRRAVSVPLYPSLASAQEQRVVRVVKALFE